MVTGRTITRSRTGHSWRRVAVMGLVAAWLLVSVPGAIAESGSTPEYAVKAAFLYNFSKFVDWPAEAFDRTPDRLVVCVLGEDPFGAELDQTLLGKRVQDKELIARRIRQPSEARSCHMVFVGSSDTYALSDVLEALDGASVLTVAEMPNFAVRGGMIQLSLDANKVRFTINLDAARRARLQMSSQLLRLATQVINGGQEAPLPSP